MSENREEILADFQACTGIEDVGLAIYHLDETNWDLLRAVSRVMPPDSQSFQSNTPDVMIVNDPMETAEVPSSPVDSATDIVNVGNNCGPSLPRLTSSHNQLQSSLPSTSSDKDRAPNMIRFNVQYCDRVVPVEVPDTGTVADIKLKLHQELKIAPCRQLLSSWARMPTYYNTPLSKLMLPKENTLHLTIQPSNSGFTADEEGDVTERLKGRYTLNVTYESEPKKTFKLQYEGSKSILDVKSGLHDLTSVPVRNQIWSGWPPNIDDHTVLALSGINYPEHNLTMRRKPPSNHNTQDRKPSSSSIIQIDSDDDEFEDASESFNVDDDYFVDNMNSKRPVPLIPENIEDEIVGSVSFSEQFTARYGPIHPAFYQGTLEDAIKEACLKPAKDRKILAIYLHHDASVLTNVFCTELLGFESVMQLFERNFVLWGWDLTFESNKARLQVSLSKNLGPMAAVSLHNIPVDRLPAIFIIMKVRSTTEIFSVVHGNVGVNELLSSLIEAVEVFTEHQKVEVKEEAQRAERELVKWEQDQAYRESLEADRAKEESKRQLAEAEKQARQKIEEEKASEEAKREAFRKQVEANLPPEPSMSQGDNLTKIRFRLPKGQNLERVFQVTTPLKVLLDYLIVQGYPTEQYKVISSWPRRDLTSIDSNKTLHELKLFPQETVILEER